MERFLPGARDSCLAGKLPPGRRDKPHFQALLTVLRSPAFRNEVAGMGGYDLSHTGEILAET